MASLAKSTQFTNLNATGQNITAGIAMVVSTVITNAQAATAWVSFYDLGDNSKVTIGTTVPALTINLAANTTLNVRFDPGWAIDKGLSVFSTTADPAGGGSTGSANGVHCQVWIN